MLFPPGAPVGVPILPTTESLVSTRIAQHVSERLTAFGQTVGLAAADALWVGVTCLRFADPEEHDAARKILDHPAILIAVIEVDPMEILQPGLCFDFCDIAAVTARKDPSAEGFPPVESVVCRLPGPAGHVLTDASPAIDEFACEASVTTFPEIQGLDESEVRLTVWGVGIFPCLEL